MHKEQKKEMPVGKIEDVEFSRESADQDDLEAVSRAEAADRRQDPGKNMRPGS